MINGCSTGLRMPGVDALVRSEGLALHFDHGRTRALDGLDIAIAEGEFVAVVGPSGCGKSTLLNLIGALDAPTAGRLWFRGRDYAAMSDLSDFRRRHVGFIFQSFHLIPTLSALDNVILPTLGGTGRSADRRYRARELLARLGLADRLDHLPANLSGGERQRVAIARALINDPDLILADEPTGSLDSANAEHVLDLIADLRREHELTVIMVTHDASVSARADRLLSLRDGRIDSGARP